MAFQFIHIESYGRVAGKGKAGGNSVKDVVAEVTRDPNAAPHVEQPQRPDTVYGCDPHQLTAMAEEYAASMTNTFTRKNRKTGTEETVSRKMRADGLCMIGGVFSAPADMPTGTWPEYRQAMIDKLKEEFGDRLKSVQEHHDEPYRHCHFYVIPKPKEHFDQAHPGKRAAAAVDAAGEVKGKQNTAYIEAMRRWQDSYWKDVSSKFAMARIGPKKQRISRQEWQAQQAALLASATVADKAKVIEVKLRKQHEAIQDRKADVEAREHKVRSIGGMVGMAIGSAAGSFVAAALVVKDWLVERDIWPGVKRSHEIEQRAREALAKRDKTINDAKDKAEGLQRQLDRAKRLEHDTAGLQKQLESVKGQVKKLEGYNSELAIENNDLKRAIKNKNTLSGG